MSFISTASETAHLTKLADYGVLDTPPEREFDEITAAVAQLFKMPMSAVSLIDRDRQWFKSRYGISANETPRDQAFCAHAIQGDNVYVVPDATRDPLFSENPLVTGDPSIRFYAGAPLITPDNVRIGTLCVIDNKPHAPPSEDMRTVLTMLARLVVRELENRRLAKRAEHQAHMTARLTEAVIALTEASNMAAIASILGDRARRFCAADIVRVAYSQGDKRDVVFSKRNERDEQTAPLAWDETDAALAGKPPGRVTTNLTRDMPVTLPSRGAWIGVRLGKQEGAGATLQLWRQLTSGYTELEIAIVTDLVRVGSSMIDRMAT